MCCREDKLQLPIEIVHWDPVKQEIIERTQSADFLLGFKGAKFIETGFILNIYNYEKNQKILLVC